MSLKKLLNRRSKAETNAKQKSVGQEGPKQANRPTQKVRRVKSDKYHGNYHQYSNKLSYDDLVNAESAIGRTIFGPIPEGHQREFFEYRKNVWIWHERFVTPNGVMQDMTVRYEVRPDGVFKRPGNGSYHKIEGVELNNFRKAAQMYLDLIKAKLYS